MLKLIKLFFLIFILLIGFIFVKESTIFAKIKYPTMYEKQVLKYSNEFKLDENLIYSVIKAESNFYPYAKSKRNAMGLMQIIDTTWNWGCTEIDVLSTNYYNIDQNIKIGTWYLNRLIKEFDGSEELAILAYNAGPGNVRSWIRDGMINGDDYKNWNIPYKETKDYIYKVLFYKQNYIELY